MNGIQPGNDDRVNELEKLLHTLDAGLETIKTLGGQDVLSQVKQRKALAKRLSLPERLLRIYDEVKFVPEQRKQVLEQWGCVVSSQQVSGADLATVVRFDLKQTPYALCFREPPVSYEAVYAYLDLSTAAGELIFSCHLRFDVVDSGHEWVPLDVDAFIPGDWVRDFLTLSTLVEVDVKGQGVKTKPQQIEDLKKKFGLG